jgi:CRP-like cAMP-binding protein
MVGIDFLQSHALFGGLSERDLKKVVPLLKEATFSRGTTIITQAEPGDRLYFICKGSVEVVVEMVTPDGPVSKRLAVLGEGDTFGEMELIDIQPRSATVNALEDVEVLELTNMDVHSIYKNDLYVFTMIIMNLAREISRRLRKMDALVASSLYFTGAQGPPPA